MKILAILQKFLQVGTNEDIGLFWFICHILPRGLALAPNIQPFGVLVALLDVLNLCKYVFDAIITQKVILL